MTFLAANTPLMAFGSNKVEPGITLDLKAVLQQVQEQRNLGV